MIVKAFLTGFGRKNFNRPFIITFDSWERSEDVAEEGTRVLGLEGFRLGTESGSWEIIFFSFYLLYSFSYKTSLTIYRMNGSSMLLSFEI